MPNGTLEALGMVEIGKGGPATESGLTARSGRIPINPSGGLKSKGHPVGATGVAQLVEVTEQLRGNAGKRQLGAYKGKIKFHHDLLETLPEEIVADFWPDLEKR